LTIPHLPFLLRYLLLLLLLHHLLYHPLLLQLLTHWRVAQKRLKIRHQMLHLRCTAKR
jgi:hypothetical protein